MKRSRLVVLLVVSMVVLSFTTSVVAQPTAPQTIGGIAEQEENITQDRNLNRLIKEKKARVAEEAPEEVMPDEAGEKVLITQIIVEDVTLIEQADLSEIIFTYEGKELSLKQMQKVADLITDKYRVQGYATSRAYIPPQTIKDGILIIRVIEGRLGNLSIEGNRYFKTSLLEDKIGLAPNEHFDYAALQNSLVYINEHPDRIARVTLAPGQEPGTTDVIINVEDNYPFHVGIEYDNYGSRYIERNRYSVVLEHNNLLGFDDKLYLKLQDSEQLRLQSFQGRYIFPVNSTLSLGTYFVHSRSTLGQEFLDLKAGGKAKIYGVFANKVLFQNDDLDVRLNLGFDYKDILNEQNSVHISDDDLRVAKVGVDVDYIDRWGRNILTAEYDTGIPDLWGGMPGKDPDNASRASAGGKFQKIVLNFFRLQPLPFASALLWKNSGQITNHNLTASEQFQIGGATSVRGYPAAESSGDKGYYSALEWSFPLYGLSKDMNVFARQEKLYDALRFVLFYDFGFVNTKTTGTDAEDNQTLKGWGAGVRLNVSDDFSFRVELGWPIDGPMLTDGDHVHTWIESIIKF